MRLLVNAPSGYQEVIEVGEGGGYFDLSRVLWDERTDGPLPDVTPGFNMAVVAAGGWVSLGQAKLAARALLASLL